MGLKCRIGRKADGTLLVTNENGFPSSLYQQALAYTKNEKDALEMWAVASTPDFVESIGKKGTVDDVSLESVIQYYNSNKKLIGTLTPSETFEVKQMMADHNVGRLSEMAAKLKEIFYEGNIPNFYPEKAINSGLFTSEDIKNINLARIGDLIMRMEADALVNDFSIETSTPSSEYRNPSVRNIFGASEVIPMEAVYQEVIAAVENPQSEQEIRQAVQELPYTDLITKFNEDETFAEKFISRFKNIRKIPVVEERDNTLVADITDTFSLIKNTISTDFDQLDIEAEILYIENIPENIWEESKEDVAEVIKEIESDLADKNIDIVGLNEVTTDQPTILRVLNAVNDMVKNPTNQNIQAFSDVYDGVFGKTATKSVEKLPKELDGLTIVRMHSEKSDQQLFEQHGLIKVGDGLYHKIRTTDSLTDLYEAVYQQVKNGLVEIPERFNLTKDVNQKENTLKDIEKFINSRKTGLDFYNERASLYQVIFGHPTMDNTRKINEDMKSLAGVVTNVDYLKAGFISDFYNYILKEKLKNSAVYRNTLSKISINNRDITIGNDISDLKNIEFYEELMDYLALKKDSTGKKYIAKEFKQDATNVLTVINFPETVGEYSGVKNIVGNLMSIPRTVNSFVRIGDTLYQKVGENPQTSVFVKVRPSTDNLYYQTEVETENYTKEQVEQMKKQDMAALSQLTPDDIEQRNQKNGSLSKFVQAVKQKSIEYAKKVQANFQIISDGNKLTKGDDKALRLAINLEKQGKSKEEIYAQTKWFRIKGNLWRREIDDITLIPFTPQEIEEFSQELFRDGKISFPLTDIFDTKDLGKRINVNNIDLEITFNEKEKNNVVGVATQGENGEKIRIEITGSKEFAKTIMRGGEYGRENIRGGLESRQISGIFLSKTIESVVNHEFQHLLQNKGINRKVGNGVAPIIKYYLRRTNGVIRQQDYPDFESMMEDLGKYYGKPDFLAYVDNLYRNSIGEREATSVEFRLKDKTTFPDTFESAFDVDINDLKNGSLGLLGENRVVDEENLQKSDIKFEQNLIEFIKQKGINVIADSKVFADKIKEMGFESLNAMVQSLHGSPYLFDKFSTEKIGTGEGNLLFGWGLYFTDLPSIAKRYATKLAKKELSINGEPLDSFIFKKKDGENKRIAYSYIVRFGGWKNPIKSLEDFEKTVNNPALKKYLSQEGVQKRLKEDLGGTDNLMKYANAIVEDLIPVKDSIKYAKGIIYNATLNKGKKEGDDYTWLDWGEPLSESNRDKIRMSPEYTELNLTDSDLTKKGGELYKILSQKLGSSKDASLYLLSTGISGTRYKTGTTTLQDNSNKGFNYVVFDENAITIEEKIQFLQTPQGNILGFEKNGSIYLDPTKLNNTTTLHELIHVFQQVLDIRASKGDKQAQSILQKRKDLFQDEATFWKEYHKFNVAPKGVLQAQIAGIKTAAALDEQFGGNRLDMLDKALDMSMDGASPREIKRETNWEEVNGQWVYEIPDGEIINSTFEIETTYQLSDVLDNQEVTTVFPDLKVKFTTDEQNKDVRASFNYNDKTISVNLSSPRYKTASAGEGVEFRSGARTFRFSERELKRSIIHEISHAVQEFEGFSGGGSPGAFIRAATSFAKIDWNETTEENIRRVKLAKENTTASNNLALTYLELFIKADTSDRAQEISNMGYTAMQGEVQARNVEDRAALTLQEKRELLFSDTQDIQDSFQIKLSELINKIGGNNTGFARQMGEMSDANKGRGGDTQTVSRNTFTQSEKGGNANPRGNQLDGEIPSFQIIGEIGATNLDAIEEATFRMDNLRVAREMSRKVKGKNQFTKEQIFFATGWEIGVDGLWRYEIPDGTLKNGMPSFGLHNLEDVLESKILDSYPEIREWKVRIPKISNVMWFNISKKEILIPLKTESKGVTITPIDFKTALLHELQHGIQELEGFTGGSNLNHARDIFGSYPLEQKNKVIDQYNKDIKVRKKDYERNSSNIYTLDLDEVNINSYDNNKDFLYQIYTSIAGEVEARNVEYRSKYTPQQRRETLLQETEDVSREDQIFLFQTMTTSPAGSVLSELGLDLSSPVYAQSPGESDVDYNNRMLREVEAFITAPKIAEKLENLRNENPSLWQQIMDFITNLKAWLKTQIGLSDYQGDIISMTKEEYIDALGVSVLKDEYTSPIQPSLQKMQNDIMLKQMALDSRIEILILPSEQEEQDLLDKMDSCGL